MVKSRVNVLVPSPHPPRHTITLGVTENFVQHLSLSGLSSTCSIWHISIPKSHAVIACRLELIDLAVSFKPPVDKCSAENSDMLTF